MIFMHFNDIEINIPPSLLDDRSLNMGEKMFLVYLMHFNKQHLILSQDQMAKKMGIGVKTVNRTMNTLRDKGYVKIEITSTKYPNLYKAVLGNK